MKARSFMWCMLATVVCFAAGFGFARWRSNADGQSLDQSAPSASFPAATPAAGGTAWKHPLMAELAQTLAETIDRESGSSAQTFSGPDLRALCAAAHSGSPGFVRARAYARAWARANPRGMFDDFLERGSFSLNLLGWDDGTRATMRFDEILFPGWMRQDEAECLRAFEQIPVRMGRAGALKEILGVLWESDPAKATALLAGADGPHYHWPGTFALEKATADQAGERFARLSALPGGAGRDRVLADFMNEAAVADPAVAAALWAQCDGPTKTTLAAAGYKAPVQDEHVAEALALARIAVEATATPDARDTFLSHYGEAWARTDLAGAVEWVSAQVKGRARPRRLLELFVAGFAADAVAASRGLAALPPGPSREYVVDHVDDYLGHGDSRMREAFFDALTPAEAARARGPSGDPFGN